LLNVYLVALAKFGDKNRYKHQWHTSIGLCINMLHEYFSSNSSYVFRISFKHENLKDKYLRELTQAHLEISLNTYLIMNMCVFQILNTCNWFLLYWENHIAYSFKDVYPLKIFRKIFNMKIFEERNIFDIVSNDSDFIDSTNELFSLILKNCWKWSIDHNCHYSYDKLKCILIMIHAWLCLIREYDFVRKHDTYVQYIFVVSSHICISFFIYIILDIFW